MMNSRICEMLDIEFPLVAFTHCRDVAKGMMLVMEKSPGATNPINLGSGGGCSIKELVEVDKKISKTI